MRDEKGETRIVHYVGKVNIELYKCVVERIVTEDVIITEKQIKHIKEKHPGDYEACSKYFSLIVSDPDYIIESRSPNTAIILKRITINGKITQTILRLATPSDKEGVKNSIITFMCMNEKRWERYLRTKNILYSKGE